uniref:Uncharacterized protein n=1 Tax=Suncus murinus ribovirus 2 TaxID=3139576 RepID=A0AB38ZKC5_9VIRU
MAAAVLELGQAAAEIAAIADGIATTGKFVKDELSSAYDLVTSSYRKIFPKETYDNTVNKIFAYSQTWLWYEDAMLVLNKMMSLPFTSYSDVMTIYAVYGLLYNGNAHLMFSPVFPQDRAAVCFSMDDDIIAVLLDIASALSIKRKNSFEDITMAKARYHAALQKLFAWMNERKRVVFDKARFELEFNLN